MTNQDYMDLLKRFALGESTTRIKIDYGANGGTDMVIRYFVDTGVYHWDTKMPHDPGPVDCNVIEIMDGELIMLMPNIMDAYLAQNHTARQIRELYRLNAIQKGQGHSVPNQFSMSQISIPFYKDEAERFQRELMGEIVLYESHIQYLHKIVQDAHDAYEIKMRETWDKHIFL